MSSEKKSSGWWLKVWVGDLLVDDVVVFCGSRVIEATNHPSACNVRLGLLLSQAFIVVQQVGSSCDQVYVRDAVFAVLVSPLHVSEACASIAAGFVVGIEPSSLEGPIVLLVNIVEPLKV